MLKTPLITIYSIPSCQYCKLAKEFLSEHGFAYHEVNVEDNTALQQKMIKLSGQMGGPVLTVADKTIIGFDKKKLGAILGI